MRALCLAKHRTAEDVSELVIVVVEEVAPLLRISDDLLEICEGEMRVTLAGSMREVLDILRERLEDAGGVVKLKCLTDPSLRPVRMIREVERAIEEMWSCLVRNDEECEERVARRLRHLGRYMRIEARRPRPGHEYGKRLVLRS